MSTNDSGVAAFMARCAKVRKLNLTSRPLTSAVVEVTLSNERMLQIDDGRPLGVIDLALEVPVIYGVRAVELLAPIAGAAHEALNVLASPMGETDDERAARRASVQERCNELAAAVMAITELLNEMASTSTALTEVAIARLPRKAVSP